MCGKEGNAKRLLLCGACPLGYHTHCLTPQLAEVPQGDWFCPPCSASRADAAITVTAVAAASSLPARCVRLRSFRAPRYMSRKARAVPMLKGML